MKHVKDSPSKFVFECPAEEIAAYIDGELGMDVENALERHMEACEICRRELNDQKGFLIALSDTLEREIPIELPPNFTKTVVINAESKVSGLRDRRERSTAFIVAAGLLVIAAAAVGSLAGVFSPVSIVFEKIFALGAAGLQVLGDFAYAVGAILRSVLQTQTFGTALAYIAVCFAVVLMIYIGSRSLKRYFRTPGT